MLLSVLRIVEPSESYETTLVLAKKDAIVIRI